MVCLEGCGKPATTFRGDFRFATYACKAAYRRKETKNESERMERAKAFALGGQEGLAAPFAPPALPSPEEMRSIIEEREGVRIVNGKVFKGDLAFVDSSNRLDKLREALGVSSHESLAERVNLRLHRMAVSR